ncbi:MAG TPA: hypothetical protein VK658_14845 [Chryseolinea sp.]|nr:hypothetical protein [Chryseolinea sp.]
MRNINRLQKGDAGSEQASSLPQGDVNVNFTALNFRHNGQLYNSAELEALASQGDEAALQVIAELVALQSGVIEITDVVILEEGEGQGDESSNEGGQNNE